MCSSARSIILRLMPSVLRVHLNVSRSYTKQITAAIWARLQSVKRLVTRPCQTQLVRKSKTSRESKMNHHGMNERYSDTARLTLFSSSWNYSTSSIAYVVQEITTSIAFIRFFGRITHHVELHTASLYPFYTTLYGTPGRSVSLLPVLSAQTS